MRASHGPKKLSTADQQYPQVPGHEIAGIVTAIGKNVTKFKIGDKEKNTIATTSVPC